MSLELWWMGVALGLAAAVSAAQAMGRRDTMRAALGVIVLLGLGTSMALPSWPEMVGRWLDLGCWALALAFWPASLRESDDDQPCPLRCWPWLALGLWGVAGPGLDGLVSVLSGTVRDMTLLAQQGLRVLLAVLLVAAVWPAVKRREDTVWALLISGGALWAAWVTVGAGWMGVIREGSLQAGLTGAWALCGVGLGLRRMHHLRVQVDAARRVDPLTGLMSREAWWELAEQQRDGAERHGYWLTVVALRFRAEARDEPQKGQWVSVLGKTLKPGIRKADLATRWDDQWLVLVLPHTTVDAVPPLLKRWEAAMQGMVPEKTGGLVAGLAALEDGESLLGVLVRAQNAAEQARQDASVRWVVAPPSGAGSAPSAT